MPELRVYKHLHADGGIRYGAAVNYRPVLFREIPGRPDEDDPSMTAYVEVRFFGKAVPREPERVREWLLAQAAVAQSGLATAAEFVRHGQAIEWPIVVDVDGA